MSESNGSPPTGTGTSRARALRPAVRRPLKARISLSGASGAGKTWSGLQIATVLADGGPIVWIDTEATTEETGSSETYADAFKYEIIDWQADWGYDPRDLEATLWDLARRPVPPVVVGVDSGSHFWRGRGGTLSIADNRITGWKGARPVQDHLVETILRVPYHLIVCLRAKMDYAIEDVGGKQQVTKLGMAPIQSEDLEYEMQVALMIDHNHKLELSKTRAAVLSGRSWEANEESRFAQLYKSWLDSGEPVIRQFEADALISAANAIPQEQRGTWREAFKSAWGSPAYLRPDQLDAVWEWVFASTAVEPHSFHPNRDQPDRCDTCHGGKLACRWHRGDAPTPIESGEAPRTPQEPSEPSDGSDTPATPVAAVSGDPDAPDDLWAREEAEARDAWVAQFAPTPPKRAR